MQSGYYQAKQPKPRIGQLPCQNCGRMVPVILPFLGCVFCSECAKGVAASDSEHFHKQEIGDQWSSTVATLHQQSSASALDNRIHIYMGKE